MNMFCYQCQEAARNVGCTTKGVCGKEATTANHMDVLIHAVKGLAYYTQKKARAGNSIKNEGHFILQAFFATITNANFDTDRIVELTFEALARKRTLPRSWATRTRRSTERLSTSSLRPSRITP